MIGRSDRWMDWNRNLERCNLNMQKRAETMLIVIPKPTSIYLGDSNLYVLFGLLRMCCAFTGGSSCTATRRLPVGFPWTIEPSLEHGLISKPFTCALHFGAGDGNTGDGHGPAAARSRSAGFALFVFGRMPTFEWASVDARDFHEIYVGSSFSADFCCQVVYLSGLCHTSHPKASTARGQGHAIKMTMDDRWQGMMKENANGLFMAITQSHPRFIRIKISPGGAGAFCQGVRPLRTKRHGAYMDHYL